MILSTFINYYDNLQDLERDRVFTLYTLGVIPKYRQY